MEQNENNSENKNGARKKKTIDKKIIIAISGVAFIFLMILTIFAFSSIKRNQTIKQANSLIEMGKFEDGIAIYDQLLIKKYIPELVSKRDLAIELMESDENLKKGIEAFDDDEKQKAIKYLSKVPKTDKSRYEKALEILEELEEEAVLEIEELVNNENLDEASKLVSSYLKLYPDSVDIQNIEQDIISKNLEIENNIKADQQAQKDAQAACKKAAESESVNIMKKEEARNIADNLKHSTKSIIAKQANLRNAPTINSSVVSVLQSGTQVYIYDTQIESSSRIWCKVQDEYGSYGWISYNTMNYTIK